MRRIFGFQGKEKQGLREWMRFLRLFKRLPL
jgi:hypothetical protein